MSISGGLVRHISEERVRRPRLPAGREGEDIDGSEGGGTGQAVRGKGAGGPGDAGEAWRRGLEEGDRGGEVDGGGDRRHVTRIAHGIRLTSGCYGHGELLTQEARASLAGIVRGEKGLTHNRRGT